MQAANGEPSSAYWPGILAESSPLYQHRQDPIEPSGQGAGEAFAALQASCALVLQSARYCAQFEVACFPLCSYPA